MTPNQMRSAHVPALLWHDFVAHPGLPERAPSPQQQDATDPTVRAWWEDRDAEAIARMDADPRSPR